MSTSQGVNVLRWSALVAGIFYGFSHQRTITANNAAAREKAAYNHKADLISKAKAEWAKKNLPPQAKTASGDIITDPNDKNFDLEAYLTKLQAES
ncbi:F1F0 ATP synthase subunit e, mitochondrial [Cladophialophora chaetospira]|uniref:ATP synthase F(0) complex subunit e, mitochondrial n=1 Tax=Cladophialophora chaetospira TaxID=386627 RepID=A0AA38XKI0_9EURO|nr:F1F0 ATP synthase subunit e, mitochondrial [Cladophialophora chaetospira]